MWGSGRQPPARPLQHSVGWGSVMRLGGVPAPPWSPQPPHGAPSPILTPGIISGVITEELGWQRGPIAVGIVLSRELQGTQVGAEWGF